MLNTCSLVVLDSFDISNIEGLSEEKTERAEQILSEKNPNRSWSEGLHGTDKRFVPINGALSPAQLAWLEETLTRAAEEEETVMVFCHVPLHPLAANIKNILWNYQVSLSLSVSVSV